MCDTDGSKTADFQNEKREYLESKNELYAGFSSRRGFIQMDSTADYLKGTYFRGN